MHKGTRINGTGQVTPPPIDGHKRCGMNALVSLPKKAALRFPDMDFSGEIVF
jgi:hypothetical protein